MWIYFIPPLGRLKELEVQAGLEHQDTGGEAAGGSGNVPERGAVDVGVGAAEGFGVGEVFRGGAELEGESLIDADALDDVHIEAEGAGSVDGAGGEGAEVAGGRIDQDGGAVDGDGAEGRESLQVSKSGDVGDLRIDDLGDAGEVLNAGADAGNAFG